MIRPRDPFAFDVEPSTDGWLVVAKHDAARIVVSECDTEGEAVDVCVTLESAAAGKL